MADPNESKLVKPLKLIFLFVIFWRAYELTYYLDRSIIKLEKFHKLECFNFLMNNGTVTKMPKVKFDLNYQSLVLY